MKAPGIIDGVIVALVISLGAAVASLLLGGFIGYGTLFNAILLAATLTYLLYLFKRSSARVGRVAMLAGWSAISLACWLFDLLLFEQVLIQAGFIWLVRALYFHGSLFSAALDFGLVSAGLAVGSWAMVNTGSLAAALWSFFLLQSLFCWIPNLSRKQGDEVYRGRSDHAAFQSAHRVALDAVRKLSQP
ncbi:MAG: hypothetical protein GWP56_17265 [Gammaproteobacteria bacterium]|jgi:hypothetical protein|nr:hypothetical protein [Gammaproteobacteria bacterium]